MTQRSSRFLDIKGMQMHYVDQGSDSACGAIVMLHGNPTWSYLYRNLAEGLASTHRVVVPDHMGMGLSDKPQQAPYCLAFHIDNLTQLIQHLDLRNITLVVHDWGGAIGFGYAVNHPQNVQKIVVLNSAAFYDSALPKRIALCRGVLGKFLVQRLNLFARAALYMTTTKKLSKESKKEYLRPYRSVASRIGIYSFLQDIPVKPDHATRHLLDSIESRLPEIRSQLLILWGKKDFCFTEHFYHRWKTFFPAARSVLYETAGHLVTEDASDEVLREIREFVQ